MRAPKLMTPAEVTALVLAFQAGRINVVEFWRRVRGGVPARKKGER